MTKIAGSLRRGLLVAGFILGCGGTIIGLGRALEALDISPVAIQADSVSLIRDRAEAAAMASQRGVRHQVLILGSSMLMSAEVMKPYETVPSRLEQVLRRQLGSNSAVKVHSYALPGSGYSTFYFLADRLAATGVDQVVIEFNPTTFAKSWRQGRARTDHVGWLGARRLPEALSLPLYRLGLTLDRTLWTVACVEIGCAGTWGRVQREQQRIAELIELSQKKLADSTGLIALEKFHDSRKMVRWIREMTPDQRGTRRTHLQYFGDAFAGVERGDVAFEFMAAAVRCFERAGIETLVYVTPINVDYMKTIDVYDREGMRQTVFNLEAHVRAAGGDLVDLHDILTDAGFRDAVGHMTFEGEYNGSVRLARELAPYVISRMKSAAEVAN